ncbi:hypothetical protein PT974_10757 [Cladobotryum mycophilum]|uniref:Aminoglycoside phosphotransferase domain-containing protein n=1 Tax=Cladobotryum mycophilum TaxID=491253 RepID=A0ABR0SBN8_9HYPO
MASPKKVKASVAPVTTGHDSPDRMEGMNPERVLRLRRNPTPKDDEPSDQEVAGSAPQKTGANCQTLGAGPPRSSSSRDESSSQSSKTNDQSVMLVKRPRIAGAPTPVLARAKRSHSRLEDGEDSPQKGHEKAPSPRAKFHSKYLESLLHYHRFQLTVKPSPTKNGAPAPLTCDRLITNAGLLLNEMIRSQTSIPMLPFPSSAGDGRRFDQTIRGQMLDAIWRDLTPTSKYSIARQLRKIVTAMREVSPDNKVPLLGSVSSGPYTIMLDKHRKNTHWVIRSQATHSDFIDFLQLSFQPTVPRAVSTTLARQFRASYSLVLSHGELGPRHIIVDNSKIVAILGWNCAGWYPEWWDYVKFFETASRRENQDWYDYAGEIFQDTYPTELAAYQGFARCQKP